MVPFPCKQLVSYIIQCYPLDICTVMCILAISHCHSPCGEDKNVDQRHLHCALYPVNETEVLGKINDHVNKIGIAAL